MKKSIISWASAALLLFNVITLQAQTTWTVDNTPNSGAQFSRCTKCNIMLLVMAILFMCSSQILNMRRH